jgi:hypothetical protein
LKFKDLFKEEGSVDKTNNSYLLLRTETRERMIEMEEEEEKMGEFEE